MKYIFKNIIWEIISLLWINLELLNWVSLIFFPKKKTFFYLNPSDKNRRSPICTTFDSCDVIKLRDSPSLFKAFLSHFSYNLPHLYDVTGIKSGKVGLRPKIKKSCLFMSKVWHVFFQSARLFYRNYVSSCLLFLRIVLMVNAYM